MISLRLRNSQTWRDLYKSRLDLGNLGEMEDILLRSRRDLESPKHHGKICTYLGEISVISARSR